MHIIDRFLNTITMYRLVLYALGILVVLALVFGAAGIIAYPIQSMLISLISLLCVSYFADYICAALWKRDRNPESSLITALILFFILAPPASMVDGLWLVFGGCVAIVSKYLISYRDKHLFNPAAMGALVPSLAGAGITAWWVATPVLFPAMLVLGLFIVRKLRRFDLWLTFLIVALLAKAGVSAAAGESLTSGLLSWFVSWPTLFFSAIMLTEPLTMPATKSMRMVYGGLSALVFSIPFSFAGVFSTPQLALTIGNLFSFLASPKGRVRLKLVSSRYRSASVVEYTFTPLRPIRYTAGQYAEWTLPHGHADDRGVRRYFTFSSAPEEKVVRLAVRVGKHVSTFKRHLAELPKKGTLSISNIAGDFTLPDAASQKLLFIAGGVGITPFMSMIRSLQARGERRDIILLYLASEPRNFAFEEELSEAAALGVRTRLISRAPARGGSGTTREISATDIQSMAPDVSSRLVYISGPDGMVRHYRSILEGIIPGRNIKTDYFPGL